MQEYLDKSLPREIYLRILVPGGAREPVWISDGIFGTIAEETATRTSENPLQRISEKIFKKF